MSFALFQGVEDILHDSINQVCIMGSTHYYNILVLMQV